MYQCDNCKKMWPKEVLKLVARMVNGHAEAILLCPACQALYIGKNMHYTYLRVEDKVINWLSSQLTTPS